MAGNYDMHFVIIHEAVVYRCLPKKEVLVSYPPPPEITKKKLGGRGVDVHLEVNTNSHTLELSN